MTTNWKLQIFTTVVGTLIFAVPDQLCAQILVDSKPISLETGLRSWLESVDSEEKKAREILKRSAFEGDVPSNTATGTDASSKEIGQLGRLSFAKCTTAQEIKSVSICSFDMSSMGKMLGRASAYIEGIGTSITKGRKVAKGEILSLESPEFKTYSRSMAGFDLKGADLKRFYDAVESRCRSASVSEKARICLSPKEKDFYQAVIQRNISDPNFVLITVAAGAHRGPAIAHEICHAQYFQDSKFREVVDQYWTNNLTQEERDKIVKMLGENYEASDLELMKNEFQAYLLEPNASKELLKDFVQPHRDRLLAALQQAGVPPVKVEQVEGMGHKRSIPASEGKKSEANANGGPAVEAAK